MSKIGYFISLENKDYFKKITTTKNMKKIIIISILLFFKINSYAQNVGIGTSTPQSLLSVGSTSQFQVDSVGNIKKINNIPYSFPTTLGISGQVLKTNGAGVLTWQNDSIGSGGSGSGWGLAGNSGTNANTNFIGTTDSVALVFKVNNAKAGLIDPNKFNTFLGLRSGNSITSGTNNTAFGQSALQNNTTGWSNTANGFQALYSNTSGSYITAIGTRSLYSNTTGTHNTANGFFTLVSNTSGKYNTANGFQALYTNTIGEENTASGFQVLYANTTGNYNTAIGSNALGSNTSGNYNSAYGKSAMQLNTTGQYNTSIGNTSLLSNTTGSYNTAIGYYSDVNAGTYSNSSAIGNVSIITASNQVRIGNGSITSIGGQVGWSTLSDGRFKENVKEEVPGLLFINQLRPVTYHYNFKKFDEYIMKSMPDSLKAKRMQTNETYQAASANTYTGFIAQEVEATAQKVGYNFSGVDNPKNEGDTYSLRYAEFVVPLVKSVQELSAENLQLKADMALIKKQLEDLKTLIQTNK